MDKTRRRILTGTLVALVCAAVVTPIALAGRSTDQPEQRGPDELDGAALVPFV